jgi:hypothetical protein
VLPQPGVDALDDEEALAGLDEAEAPSLAGELGVARGRRDEPLKLAVLRSELPHLRGPRRDGAPRSQVRPRGLEVGESDEAERADRGETEEAP